MALVNRCDRCGFDEIDPVANRNKPNGWETVCGTDLCPKCSKLLHEFLAPIPIELKELRNEPFRYPA